MTRPRGYFGRGRDTFLLDGNVPPGINEGVPGEWLLRPAADTHGLIRAIGIEPA